MSMRLAGATLEQVGLAMGISTKSAQRLIIRTLRDAREHTNSDATEHRQLQLARLEAIHLKLWPKSSPACDHCGRSGDEMTPQRADALVKVLTRQARLLGLDQSEEVRLKLNVDGPMIYKAIFIDPETALVDDGSNGHADTSDPAQLPGAISE